MRIRRLFSWGLTDNALAADFRLRGVNFDRMPMIDIYWTIYRHYIGLTDDTLAMDALFDGAPPPPESTMAVLGYSVEQLARMVEGSNGG